MNEHDRLKHMLELVRAAACPHRLASVLGDDVSDAPGTLVPLAAARESILRRRGAGLKCISSLNRIALAARVLLGRRPDLLDQLSPFWTINGTPKRVVDKAVGAVAVCSAHPGGVVDLSGNDPRSLQPFPGYGRFVAVLRQIEDGDPQGPLGEAIRVSRYAGGSRRTASRPFLPGEMRGRVGFPVALGQGQATATTLCDAAWVQPVQCWPLWLSASSDTPPEWATERLAACRTLQVRWNGLIGRINDLLRSCGYEAALGEVALPEWLMLFVALHGVEDIESAGLALSLQALAAGQDWPLPAGVGFSAAWGDDGRLRAISRLREKARAALDGGIFLLFACAEPDNLPADVVEAGLHLALLPPGASLPEVVRLVNTACHSFGLTVDRSECVSEAQRDRCRSMRAGRLPSRLLPEPAATGSLPIGFIGRSASSGCSMGGRVKGRSEPAVSPFCRAACGWVRPR